MKGEAVALEVKLNREMEAISSRDYQLWAIGVLVMLVLLSGVFALVAPSALWRQAEVQIDTRYVPQLLLGLIALVLLLNFYLVGQKRKLRHVQQRLVGEILESNRLQQFMLLDRPTGVFSKAFLHEVVAKESAHANRFGKSVTFISVEASCCSPCREVDQVPVAASQILKSTFRGSDTILRIEGSTFLVVMPETKENEALIALRRLASKADDWNMNAQSIDILLNFQTASYEPQGDMWASIEQAQQAPKRSLACMSEVTLVARPPSLQSITAAKVRRDTLV
jgi:GGDEF domain-containing protein